MATTNLWECLVDAVKAQLTFLLVPSDRTAYETNPESLYMNLKGGVKPTRQLRTYVREPNIKDPLVSPTERWNTPIVKITERGSYQYDIIESEEVPSIFISFGPSRLDPTAPAQLGDFVEQVSIQIEVVLHDGAGAPMPGTTLNANSDENQALQTTRQAAGVREDLHELLSASQLEMAVDFPPRVQIRDAKIIEWSPDYNYFGSPQQVFIMMLQAIMVYDRYTKT